MVSPVARWGVSSGPGPSAREVGFLKQVLKPSERPRRRTVQLFSSASDRLFASPAWKYELKMQSAIHEQLVAHGVPASAVADFEGKNLRSWSLPAQFPTADSIYAVSRVGFSDDGQVAVVYREFRGGICYGSGDIHLYRQWGAGWKRTGILGLWVQ